MKKKLHLGIFIDDGRIPLWINKLIEKIINLESVEIKLILNVTNIPLPIDDTDYSFGYLLHEKLDKFIFKNKFEYNNNVKLTDHIIGITRISVISKNDNQESHKAIKETYKAILKHDLDIILSFSSSSLKAYANTAKYGILSYHIGDDRIIRGFSNGYWEIIKNMQEIGVRIQITNDPEKDDSVIYRSWLAKYSNSLHINRDRLYSLISILIMRILNNLFIKGPEYLHKLKEKYDCSVDLYNNKYLKPPTTLIAFSNMITIILRLLLIKLFPYSKWNWFLLYNINNNANSFPANIYEFDILKPAKDKFWADPFIISKNNRFYIFIEEFLYKSNKGHISFIELDNNGRFIRTDKILDKPYHMSYPFIFEWHNSYYLIPETGNNKTIELYKCINFPLKWIFTMNLMENIQAKDTTLFYYHGKWWLFTAVNELVNSPNHDELFLYFSDDFLTTKWVAHPNNPIVSDIKTARPAGRIFIKDNKIFRPSQNSSGRYGRSFNLCQIITLSETDYEEVIVSKVETNWDNNLKGTHTFNFDQNFTIIDVYSF